MAAGLRSGSYAPTIRCSSCGSSIALDMMAEHFCPQMSHNEERAPEVIPFRGLPIPSGRDAQSRGPRRPMQLPKIDPQAADRSAQYPYAGELTPTSSGHGSQMISPRSDSSSSSKVAWPIPPPSVRKMSTPVVRGPPSPELVSQDCAFPPFPNMPKTRSNTPNPDNDDESLKKPSYSRSKRSNPSGSINTTSSNASMPRSRKASTASSHSISKGRPRGKTIETNQESNTAPFVAGKMKRRPSLNNFLGLRRIATENLPPLPNTPAIPMGHEAEKDDLAPLQSTQSAPAEPLLRSPAPHHQQAEMEQLQQFDFQVSGAIKPMSQNELVQGSGLETLPRNRGSTASSIYPDTPQPSVAMSPTNRVAEGTGLGRERRATLSRLDGPGPVPAREPSYKAKRPAPIKSGLATGSDRPKLTSPKRSSTFPVQSADRQVGTRTNWLLARRPLISSSASSPEKSGSPLSPVRADTFPSNLKGLLERPEAAPTISSEVSSTPSTTATAPIAQPTTTSPAANLNRVSIDSASSYGSDISVAHSTSSQSSIPRDEARREIMDMTRESRAISPFSTDLPQALRPRLPRMQTDSPTDPLFANGILSPMPPSSAASAEVATESGPKAVDFRPPLITSASAPPGLQQSGRTPETPSTSEDHPKKLASRNVSQGSQAMGTNKGICRGCSKIIASSQKSVSSADGRLTGKYHKECFVCYSCKAPFATADFYVLQNLPYCADHYHELNGTLCVGCGKGIEGQYLEANTNVSMPSRKFHASCLTCATCRCQLREDYFEFNGKIYCERDASRAASPHTSRQQYDTAPSRPSPLSQGMLRADSDAGSRRFPERRTTKLMMMGGKGNLNML